MKVLRRRSFQSWWNVRFGKLLIILSLEPHKIPPKTKHTGKGLGTSIFKKHPTSLRSETWQLHGRRHYKHNSLSSRGASPGPTGWRMDCVAHGEWGLCCEEPAAPQATVLHKARIGHPRQLSLFTAALMEVCSGTSIYGWVTLGIEWMGKRKKWRTQRKREYKRHDSLKRTYLFLDNCKRVNVRNLVAMN